MEFFYKFLLLTFLFIAINGRPQVWQGQSWQGQGLQGQGLQGQSWQGQGLQGQGWRGQSNIGNRDPVHIGALNGGNSGIIGGQHRKY